MTSRTEIYLHNFYIFNSFCGPKEGEESKKILFFYPSDTDEDVKIKDVGLSEAIIKFTNTFTQDDSCQSLHTQKTLQLYYQPEKEYWMVMTINVPFEVKLKNKIAYNEYKSDDVHDSIYKAILKQSYKMFRLFMGTFELNFVGESLEVKTANLVNKLDHFYSKYVLTLKLQNSDILDVFQSVQYLPLNQLLFLRVNNFIKVMESTYSSIKHSIFLYSEHVFWSGINPTDLYSIYEYLVGTLFPKTLSTELQGGSIPKRLSFNSSRYGGFITGPDSHDNCVKAPKMFIFNDNLPKEYYLVVYKALSGILCLFVDSNNPISDETYHELHGFIGPELTSIASEIGENFVLQTTSPTTNGSDITSNIKYLYFNELNFKHQDTIHVQNRLIKNSTIPNDIMNLITDMYEESVTSNFTEETLVKTANDYWIIKKSSNSRHFFVIINKNSTLLQITEEAKKMYDQHIKNVFFDKQ